MQAAVAPAVDLLEHFSERLSVIEKRLGIDSD
jgi:hypothetical protein